jgi:hypothetical protein
MGSDGKGTKFTAAIVTSPRTSTKIREPWPQKAQEAQKIMRFMSLLRQIVSARNPRASRGFGRSVVQKSKGGTAISPGSIEPRTVGSARNI